MTFKYVFDYREGEVCWCTADVGGVTDTRTSSTAPGQWGYLTDVRGRAHVPRRRALLEVVDKPPGHFLYRANGHRATCTQWAMNRSSAVPGTSLRLLGTVGPVINPERPGTGTR